MNKLVITAICIFGFLNLQAQDTTRKVWVSGAARGIIYGDNYKLQNEEDAITPAKLNSGHTMVDLTANIKPNAQTYINATMRVRNDYGGFWGGGVTFDMRQLYVKGLIGKVIRYQLGDLDYKLTPYTFYNNNAQQFNSPAILDVYNDMVNYDMFYSNDNTWRQQGLAADFALEFTDVIEEMQFNFFATRQNPTDFGGTSERLFYGGNIGILQSKYFDFGVNYAEMLDLLGTSNDTTSFHSPVITYNAALHLAKENWDIDVETEFGQSNLYYDKDLSFSEKNDYFYDFKGIFNYNPLSLYASASYRDVGPKFRSPGAQSLRVNYEASPAFVNRYGNDQQLRQMAMIDILRDASLYNYKLSANLQSYLPRFGNAEPYGVATPNRKGFTLKVGQENYKEKYNIEASYQSLSEIVGQGTTALRNYQTIRFGGVLHAAKFVESYKKVIDIEFSYWNENTTRTGTESFENVDYNNTSYSLGFEVETFSKLSLMWGIVNLQSAGFEYLSLRNSVGDIVDFAEYKANISESINALGLKYSFSENNAIQFNYQISKWNDADNNAPAYQFNQFALMYNLKF